MATKQQRINLARTVMNHPALDDVLKLVDEKHLARFRTGNFEAREQVNAAMDSDIAFLSELRSIVAENEPKTDDDEIVPVK